MRRSKRKKNQAFTNTKMLLGSNQCFITNISLLVLLLRSVFFFYFVFQLHFTLEVKLRSAIQIHCHWFGWSHYIQQARLILFHMLLSTVTAKNLNGIISCSLHQKCHLSQEWIHFLLKLNKSVCYCGSLRPNPLIHTHVDTSKVVNWPNVACVRKIGVSTRSSF